MYCVLNVSDFESRQKQDFFLLQNFGTSFGARPSSYSMGTEFFPGGKVDGLWSWPLTPI